MTKTYEQRLDEIAEEMARFDYEEQFQNSKIFTWDKCTRSIKQERIANKVSAAAISLKHMAHMYEGGYLTAMNNAMNAKDIPPTIKEQLQSLGLIQPQKP